MESTIRFVEVYFQSGQRYHADMYEHYFPVMYTLHVCISIYMYMHCFVSGLMAWKAYGGYLGASIHYTSSSS